MFNAGSEIYGGLSNTWDYGARSVWNSKITSSAPGGKLLYKKALTTSASTPPS